MTSGQLSNYVSVHNEGSVVRGAVSTAEDARRCAARRPWPARKEPAIRHVRPVPVPPRRSAQQVATCAADGARERREAVHASAVSGEFADCDLFVDQAGLLIGGSHDLAGPASRSVSRVLLGAHRSRRVTCSFFENLQATAGVRPPSRHGDFALDPGISGSYVFLVETQPPATDDPSSRRSGRWPILHVLKRDLYAAAGERLKPTNAKRYARYPFDPIRSAR